MRIRSFLRGRAYRTKVGGFILWLAVCSGLFLALDLYFGAHLVVNMDTALGQHGQGAGDSRSLTGTVKPDPNEHKVLVADLIDSGSKRSHGPRQKNPHRLNHLLICKHPRLDLEHDANKAAFHEMAPLICPGKSLFNVKNGVLSLNRTLLGKNQLKKCIYKGIERTDDNFPTYTKNLVRSEEPFEIKIKHDFFRIQCNLKQQTSAKRRLLSDFSENSDYLKTDSANMLLKLSHGKSRSKRELPPAGKNTDKLSRKFLRRKLKAHNSTEDFDVNDGIGPFMGEDVNNTDTDMYADWSRYYDDLGVTPDSAEENPDFDQFIVQVYPSDEVSERIKGIRKEMQENGNSQQEPLNVLVFCLDSLSHLSYQRKLPLTYDFIKTSAGSVILHGYNIVGDATTANLMPLLTGKSQQELPEARADVEDSGYVDRYPLVWYKYERKGYATMFTEDEPTLGMFNLRLNGFEHQPTDHYMRPFWQTIWGSSLNTDSERYCLGDKPKHQYTLGYLRDFFDVYPNVPKFAFSMHVELTHWDNNPGQYIDADLTAFLSGLRTSGHLNNTVVLLMADHGARYSKVRGTLQGKLEERLPMMSWIFPQWFPKKNPKLWQNFKQNSHKLTTPFDVHETLLDIAEPSRTLKPMKFSSRGISLFHAIPLNRTCKSAGIEMHWCTCLMQEVVNPSNEHVQNSVSEVMHTINQQTDAFRSSCEFLTLKSIQSAMLVVPNEKVLRYRFSQDADNRVANFSSVAKLDMAYYQVTLVTEPGDGFYEATVHADFLTSVYTVNAEISRLNRYGAQADCIRKKHPSIRKFCYCKPKEEEGVP